jgi:hypothetical protein
VIHKESTYIVEAINKKSTNATAYSQPTSLWTTISNIILILSHHEYTMSTQSNDILYKTIATKLLFRLLFLIRGA